MSIMPPLPPLIARPPYPDQSALDAQRKELATKVLLVLLGAIKTTVTPPLLAITSVAVADALLAELAK